GRAQSHLQGTRCLGAHWLTFLGPDAVEAAGGQDAIRSRLPREVSPLACGHGLLLRAGEAPTDGADAPALKLQGAVARAIALATCFDATYPFYLVRPGGDADLEGADHYARRLLEIE